MSTCSICPNAAVSEVELEEGSMIYLCQLHNTWTDDEIMGAFQASSLNEPPCQDCKGIATEHQSRHGKSFPVCKECARHYAMKEINRYGKRHASK